MRESRPIIALDFASLSEVIDFLKQFPEHEKLYVKVGMELFFACGKEVITYLKQKGHAIFLDLKLHDIPNTVSSALSVLATFQVDMINIHAAGGCQMMKQAKAIIGDQTILLAVTQLTSTSQSDMQADQNIQTSLEESVRHYAKKAYESNLDGVVCSAYEVDMIKKETHDRFICVTPGIRPSGCDNGDQKRVMTPKEAREIGSDYIVVGRPITRAKDPYAAYQRVQAEWVSDK